MSMMNWSMVGAGLGGILASAALWYCCRVLLRRRASIQDKVVLITGASSGLGEACAKVFHQHGCQVILAGRNVERLNAVKQALVSLETKAKCLHVPAVMKMDLEDVSALQQLAQQAVGLFGKVDIVINNAGISYRGCIEDTSVQVDQKLMTVNYFGHIALIKGLLPSMVSQNSGHIVGISSVQGKMSIPYRSAYSASKHALQAFFDCLRAELADTNIQVSMISPGYIRTNLSTNAVRGDGSAYGLMDKTTESGMTPEAVAERVLQCVLRGQPDVVISPLHHRLAIILRAVAPSLFFAIMARRARKQRTDYKKAE
ncbi:dehydrogenase/reductase SDR family member 7B-like [Babylonia areolata]|uniref:dehydrogenase/reductase SDR family member 7B-like n=1 Tax=Babylonia areolata TaxID=304850 RepID=UPI003FD2421A